MQSRQQLPAAEDTIIIHNANIGRISELNTLVLEELSNLIYVELNERHKDYQDYLEGVSNLCGRNPESKL